MTALLAVYHRERGVVGYCNARCYNAMQPSQLKEPRRNACVCICGGVNHAAGLARAIKNQEKGTGTRRSDIEAFAQIIGVAPDDLVVIDRLRVRNKYGAKRLASALLHPVPIGPDDLFYCEAVALGGMTEEPCCPSGSDEGGQQTPTFVGRPLETP